MKLLAIIFLVIGVISLIVMGFDIAQAGERGDRLNWLTIGPPIIASFCLGAGLALLLASPRKKKK